MKVLVYDTYVQRQDGKTMHFDILVPSSLQTESTIYDFGNEYLKSKPFKTSHLSSKECQFCHIERASETIINQINQKGFSIIEMENCN